MAEPLKAGALVRLRSGGPQMTVISADENGRVKATWFGDLNFPEVCSLPAACLVVEGGQRE